MAETPEITEEGVQEEGKPTEKPASKPTEQAEPDGVVELDVTKKYHSKRNPGKQVSGDDLWAGFSRGERFDALQSEHQKLQSTSADKDQRIAALEAQVTASATKEVVAQNLQDLGILGGQKPTVEPDDNWLGTEQPPEPTVLDPRLTASRIEETVKKTTEDFLNNRMPEIKETVLAVGQKQREEQAAVAQQQQTVAHLKANELANLRVEFPDASDADLDDVASRTVQYTGHLASAVDNYQAGNAADGNEALFTSQDVMKDLVKRRGELAQKQATVTAERKRDAEVEGLNAGTLPGEKPEEQGERKSSYKKSDVEKNHEAGLSRAHKFVDAVLLRKNSGV